MPRARERCREASERHKKQMRDWYSRKYHHDPQFRDRERARKREQYRADENAKDQAVIDDIVAANPWVKEFMDA